MTSTIYTNKTIKIKKIRDYYELTKPRVVMLMVVTAWVGMLLAVPHGALPAWPLVINGSLGIALCAGSGAVINHLIERRIDIHMNRTKNRPIASGRIHLLPGILFALILSLLGLGLLIYHVNPLCAWLTFGSLMGYAFIYTIFLKRSTPQNIVIGGAAGAAPPLLGWTAITGQLDPQAWLLVLIIFAWTPPHFWALAIYKRDEYAKTELPMLPITHGIAFTKQAILYYTIILIGCSLLPYLTGLCGLIYLLSSIGLNAGFLYHVIKLYRQKTNLETNTPYNPKNNKDAWNTFTFSILYLLALFIAMILDHLL